MIQFDSATIPAQNDSSLIRYYVSATDNDNALHQQVLQIQIIVIFILF